jgi:hypothetical protein
MILINHPIPCSINIYQELLEMLVTIIDKVPVPQDYFNGLGADNKQISGQDNSRLI